MANVTNCQMNSDNINGNMSSNLNIVGAAALLIIGEPFSSEHKELISNKLLKGLCCLSVKK